jgi:hypothetical protein
VEDIIDMSKKEEILLRRAVNYDAHHKGQKIFCISHTIHKTSLYTLLQLFNYVIFTPSPGNVPTLRNVLNHFKLEKDLIELYVRFFKLQKLSGNSYFYFVPATSEFGWSGDRFKKGSLIKLVLEANQADSSENNEAEWKAKTRELKDVFENLTSDHPNQSQAMSVFSIVVASLKLLEDYDKIFSCHDLTVNFIKNASGNVERISVVDYILDLVTPSDSSPDKRFKVLHNFVKTRCVIATFLRRNKHYD